MGKRERKISKFTGRWITEQGAGTVEYVIVVLVAIVIGAGLLAFGNQVSGQVTKTGGSISSWFSKANGTGGTGGGNAGGGGGGTDSRIEELKEKDPADWTLDDQKAVAEDIGKKGNSSELYAKAKAVKKLTNNVGDDYDAPVTATADRLFLLSYSETVETPYSEWLDWSWIGNEGTQYEAFKGKVTENNSGNDCLKSNVCLWERTVFPIDSTAFLFVYIDGDPTYSCDPAQLHFVCPAFCF